MLNMQIPLLTSQGIKDYQVIPTWKAGVRPNLNRSSFDVHVHLTEYVVRGEYNISGTALQVPFTGQGSVNITTVEEWADRGRPNISLYFLDAIPNAEGFLNLSAAGMLYSDPANFRGDWESLEASLREEFANLALTN